MLWRVRTTLPDRPGALAALTRRCGESDVNILAVQIFPGVEGVTDELVLTTPHGWTLRDVAGLVEAAGGTRVSVGRCSEQALVDGPTRYLTALRQAVHGADDLPGLLGRLLDAEPAGSGLRAVQDSLVVGAGAHRVELRRTTPFTPTEHARAAAFVAAAAELQRQAPAAPDRARDPDGAEEAVVHPAATGTTSVLVRPAELADTGALMQMHARCSAETVQRHYAAPIARLDLRLARRLLVGGAGALVAAAGDRVVGLVSLGVVDDGACEASLVVEDGWQRQGLGTRLLGSAARLAAGLGVHDVVLRGPADSPAAVAMVFGSGLRARVKLAGDELLVTVSTRGLTAPPATAPVLTLPTSPPTPAPA